MRACGGTWIAHGSGDADRRDRRRRRPHRGAARRAGLHAAPGLDHRGGAGRLLLRPGNEGLWPLCHIAFVRPAFREEDWQYYEPSTSASPKPWPARPRTEDPIVLVQDYHFALAPKMIRERSAQGDDHHLLAHPVAQRRDVRHLPVEGTRSSRGCWAAASSASTPSSTATTSSRRSIVSSRAASTDREHFHRHRWGGRETDNPALPDLHRLAAQGAAGASRRSRPAGSAVRERLGLGRRRPARRRHRAVRLHQGYSRPDDSRSTLLLTSSPEWKGRFTFVQVAAPTRSKLASYSNLQAEAVRHGGGDQRPPRRRRLHSRSDCSSATTSRRDAFELFRAADLCIVSSLHDGMNLVAEEFVAARDDGAGRADPVQLRSGIPGDVGSPDRQSLRWAREMADALAESGARACHAAGAGANACA